MEHHGKNCGACTSAEVQALFCELLDPSTRPERAAAIRAHISECEECLARLECEEVVRELLRGCQSCTPAPQSLRQRITVQISRTEVRWTR